MSAAKNPPTKSPVTDTQRDALDGAAIREHCKQLRLPTVAAQCDALAQEAVRARHSHLRFLDALLSAELEERERTTPTPKASQRWSAASKRRICRA